MTIQEPTAAPDRFIRLLDRSIEKQGFSLREFAGVAGVSIAYLSRLLSKQRGLPAKKTIEKFEKVLKIEPGQLFDAAGIHDALASNVFKNEGARQFLRSLEPLSDEERAKVLQEAAKLAIKYHPEEHEE
jgi:transcriptional regulator with XRE-family HTH domain